MIDEGLDMDRISFDRLFFMLSIEAIKSGFFDQILHRKS